MAQGVRLVYTADHLATAISESSSWRQVMLKLGYRTSNGYLAQRLRREAIELGIDTSLLPLKHVWSRGELAEAIRTSDNWQEVAVKTGLAPHGGNQARLRSIARRFDIDYSHIDRRRDPSIPVPFTAQPSRSSLRYAATLVAAAWFAWRGYAISFPAEARPYDLIVECDQILHRVQVKTTSTRDPSSGVLVCRIGRIPKRDGQLEPYDPADVDFFFIIDVNDNYYIVPIQEVAGNSYVSLSTVIHRRVDR
jgi:hypothetical protein